MCCCLMGSCLRCLCFLISLRRARCYEARMVLRDALSRLGGCGIGGMHLNWLCQKIQMTAASIDMWDLSGPRSRLTSVLRTGTAQARKHVCKALTSSSSSDRWDCSREIPAAHAACLRASAKEDSGQAGSWRGGETPLLPFVWLRLRASIRLARRWRSARGSRMHGACTKPQIEVALEWRQCARH